MFNPMCFTYTEKPKEKSNMWQFWWLLMWPFAMIAHVNEGGKIAIAPRRDRTMHLTSPFRLSIQPFIINTTFKTNTSCAAIVLSEECLHGCKTCSTSRHIWWKSISTAKQLTIDFSGELKWNAYWFSCKCVKLWDKCPAWRLFMYLLQALWNTKLHFCMHEEVTINTNMMFISALTVTVLRLSNTGEETQLLYQRPVIGHLLM